MPSMTSGARAVRDLTKRRVAALGLAGDPLGEAEDVVRHLVAVQSQDFGPACWSVAQRTAAAPGRVDIEAMVGQRRLIRTHLL